MPAYVAYYRVSTDRQGASGLGLDAQRRAMASFLGEQNQLLAEFTEVESGRRVTNRPQLQAALAECRRRGAPLVLTRNSVSIGREPPAGWCQYRHTRI